MNERQKRFAECLLACGNRTEAAKQAGYSESYAEHRSDELWRNVEIQEYYKQLVEKAQDERILTAKERQVMLSDIARDGALTQDRLRAVDILNKMTGEYVTKIEGSISAEVSDPFKGLTTEELRKLGGEPPLAISRHGDTGAEETSANDK